MKEIQIFLRPAPGAKPEFLATVRPVDPNLAALQVWDAVVIQQRQQSQLQSQQSKVNNEDAKVESVVVVLDDYTRDGWAWKPDKTGNLVAITVESTDGRNKLPGFVNFLKQRQKSAYGRFGTDGVWIVSYVQQQQQSATTKNFRMDCRICTNIQTLPNCQLKPNGNSNKMPPQHQPSAAQTASPSASTASSQPAKHTLPPSSSITTSTTAKKKGGLLGALVGAQQRTNQHVLHSHAAARAPPRDLTATHPGGGGTVVTTTLKTVQQVHAEFRQQCHDTMLDFDLDESEQVLKVPIKIQDIVRELPESERPRVTLDILKYMVYEAAEEVNEEWIAVKEPSEFLDDDLVTIVVYKEGVAPPEVLEDMNRAEVPDEVRGQQQAMQAERARSVALQEMRRKQQLEQMAHQAANNNDDDDGDDDEEEMAVLNTKKRDRRTIADYEREKRENAAAVAAKRGRSS